MEPVIGTQAAEAYRRRTKRIESRSIFARLGSLFKGSCIVVGAVIIPIAALCTEFSLRYLTTIYINPIPTWLHATLIGLIPLGVIASWRAKRSSPSARKAANFLLGTNVATAITYSIAFIPILPLGLYLLAISPMGMFVPALFGLLVLSPILALVGATYAAANLRDGPTERLVSPSFFFGIVAGLLLITGIEGPRTIARIGLEQLNADPQDQTALNLLRNFGSREVLLRASYGEYQSLNNCVVRSPDLLGGLANGMITFDGPRCPIDTGATQDSIEHARTVYFRVTGQPFYSEPRPASPLSSTPFREVFGQDADRAGEHVGGRAEGTALVSSMINGTLDPDAGFGYLEWEFVFRNSASDQEEARMELILPPKSVVSRATLWINGEEREAAVGEKRQVRAAYQKIVAYRRDPLLVTSSAPDRVLVQCFPIAPNGGEMRIRIGITVPAHILNPKRAEFELPSFSEKNFAISPTLRHSVWIESKQPLSAPGGADFLAAEETPEGAFGLRGQISAIDDINLADTVIQADRNSSKTVFSGQDQIAGRNFTAELKSGQAAGLKRIVIVVDGSASMKKFSSSIAQAIEHLPLKGEVAALIAGDKTEMVIPALTTADRSVMENISKAIAAHSYDGGVNNLPALAAGWDIAARNPGAEVVWIHGTQPAKFRGAEELENRIRRRPHGPHVYSLQIAAGGNRILADLAQNTLLKSLRIKPSDHNLEPLIALLADRTEWQFGFESQDGAPIGDSLSGRQAEQLSRLMAVNQVLAKLKTGNSYDAAKIATLYRLVTPVSGAVVLENATQYSENNLEAPSAITKIPSVPEPEAYALALMVVALITIHRRLNAGAAKSLKAEEI